MNTTIYLTKDEQTVFDSLSEEVKTGWTVEEETLTCYETLRQIHMRISLADFRHHPEVKNILEKIKNGMSPEKISLDSIDAQVQKELFFTIGARGVAAFIATLLPEIKDDEDVEALATFSSIRHELLSINASATHI
jgi:hypothetical protein